MVKKPATHAWTRILEDWYELSKWGYDSFGNDSKLDFGFLQERILLSSLYSLR
jgi:hypothetical protein